MHLHLYLVITIFGQIIWSIGPINNPLTCDTTAQELEVDLRNHTDDFAQIEQKTVMKDDLKARCIWLSE